MKSLFSSESAPLGTGDRFSSLAALLCVDLSLRLGCTGVFLPVSSYFLVRIVPHMEVFLLCLMQQVSSSSPNSAILISSSRSRDLLHLLACFVPIRNLSSYLGSLVHNIFFLHVFFSFFLITSFQQLDYNVFCIVFFHSFCWCL